MKRSPADPVVRWRDRGPDGQEAEDRAAALIRGSLAPGDPSEIQVARIEQQLLSRRRPGSLPSLRFRLALTTLFLLAGGASVEAARRMGWLDHILPGLSPAPSRPLQPRSPAKVKVAVRPSPVGAEVPPPAEAPAPAPVVEARVAEAERLPRSARISSRAASVEKAASPTPPPSEEIRAFRQAIHLLRRQHDATTALSALDAYLDRYPDGVLGREARFARVDALLILERPKQALDALETLPLDDHRRSTELQVIRGELRARSDCARAGQDFAAVLARNPDAGLAERALYGRGACRIKQRDVTGATSDLRHYLERFPNGTHATWARQWLESQGRNP